MKRYRDRSGLQMSTGNFYRELQRLMASSFVRFAAREPNTDARRAPYEILSSGREGFTRWLGTPISAPLETGEDPISSRSMFLDCVPRTTALALVDDWKQALVTARGVLERDLEDAQRKSFDERGGFSILSQLLGRRLRHLASDLAFLDELRTAVEEWHEVQGDVVDTTHLDEGDRCADDDELSTAGVAHALSR